MTSVSVDVGSAINAIRESIVVVLDQSRASKEREERARLAVYHAFSIHPALDNMRPPRGEIGDLDWYTELRSPLAFMGGIFRKIGQNEHFQRTSLLGETGRRVRIMFLLCWVIGHRLPIDRINQLLSTAVEDALNTAIPNRTDMQNLTQLWHIKKELEGISRMIRTRLPLPLDKNPFYGEDFTPEDEDELLPRSELWGYSLPENQQHEFDIKQNPSILLRPHTRVLIPMTKLSLFAIQWASRIFGLGKKVHEAGEIDFAVFWNADPPASNVSEVLQFQEEMGSVSGSDDVDPDDITLGEAWEDLPLDDWIHERFCYVYHTHGWVHDRFARILLFSAFCHYQRLPSSEEPSFALNVSRCLRQRLGYDVCCLIEPFLIIEGFHQWDSIIAGRWIPGFSVMSKEERGMSAIFVDAYNIQLDPDISNNLDFNLATQFLIHPELECPGKPDVLGIPIVRRYCNLPNFPIPELDPLACSCGHCCRIQKSITHDFENFQMKFFSVEVDLYEADIRCGALERAWVPLFNEAEAWVDSLVGRIEIAFDLFPYLSQRRLGPSILSAVHILKLEMCTHLDTKQLLRFLSLVRFSHVYPDSRLYPLPQLVGDNFAFLADDEPDRAQDSMSLDENMEIILSSAGGWLYEAISGGGLYDQNTQVSFLRSSTTMSIRLHSPNPDGIVAIAMPVKEASRPTTLPYAHELLDAPESALPEPSSPAAIQIVLDIGERGSHGFPLPPGGANSCEILGAQISTMYFGRIIRTLWRPEVRFGRPCEHAHMYHRMTRCSLTSHEVLLQVRPTPTSLLPSLLPSAQCGAHASSMCCKAHDDLFYEEHKRSTCHLIERGGPLGASKFCIVRCGDTEGPADPIILLGGSLGRSVYIFHHRECWACACSRMRSQGLGLGIAFGTLVVTKCAHCLLDERRANQIAITLGDREL